MEELASVLIPLTVEHQKCARGSWWHPLSSCIYGTLTAVSAQSIPQSGREVSSVFASITTQEGIFMLLGGSGSGALKFEVLLPKGYTHT